MYDITAFIRARLDEAEGTARAATPGPWTARPVRYGHTTPDPDGYWEVHGPQACVVEHQMHEGGGTGREDGTHIAANDPPAVLRDVEATRRLLDLHTEGTHRECALCREYDSEWPCRTARLIASRWSTHPAYRPEWAPAPEGD